ncbi:MAG: type III pantothenate kinase [Acidiferrobacterales bacterium]
MKLLIDLGNSRLKWAWSDATLWQSDAVTIDGDPASVLMETLGEPYGIPQEVGIVSVTSQELLNGVRDFIKDRWDAETTVVESMSEQGGVYNGYSNPEQLGNDRWAALVAARAETPSPVCVIGCGTAVTIDAMTDRGEFIGGTIFPGLELLRQSLRHGTDGIECRRGSNKSCQALSTEDAVMGGTLFGLAGAINRIVTEHHRVLGGNCVNILTGGTGEVVAPLLDFPVRAIPDLVLQGVRRIIEASP